MDAFQDAREEHRVNIVALDIPYLDLLKFSFKFILAWIPAVLFVYAVAFLIGAACFGAAW